MSTARTWRTGRRGRTNPVRSRDVVARNSFPEILRGDIPILSIRLPAGPESFHRSTSWSEEALFWRISDLGQFQDLLALGLLDFAGHFYATQPAGILRDSAIK